MHRRQSTSALLFLSLACLLLGGLSTAHTGTLTVTNLNDSGPGSPRQAIADAAPGDTIDLARHWLPHADEGGSS